jgi:hypothetical protein
MFFLLADQYNQSADGDRGNNAKNDERDYKLGCKRHVDFLSVNSIFEIRPYKVTDNVLTRVNKMQFTERLLQHDESDKNQTARDR